MSQYSGGNSTGPLMSTQSSGLNQHPLMTSSDDGTSKIDFFDRTTSDHSFINQQSSHDYSMEMKKKLLEKLNQDVLAEYEEARQSIVSNQQNYRSMVERFLTFASESKHIYSKTIELYEKVSKEYETRYTATDAQISMHLRLIVNVSLLYLKADQSTSLTKLLIKSPYIAFQAFEDAIQEIWKGHNTKLQLPPPRLGICGWLGRHHVTPGGLSSSMINTLSAVEGVVNKCSSVFPKLSQSVYVGEPLYDVMNLEEKSVYMRNHYDLTDFTKTFMDNGSPPPVDPLGEIVHRQEIGLSSYRNYQTFVIQETPEDSKIGQMPRYVSVIVQDDLCNIVKCGDRVRVWGVYRAGTGRADDSNTGIGRPYLVANYLTIKDKLSHSITHEIMDEDRTKFLSLANRDDALAILTRSIAPSICGHEVVKRGILLQLVGGQDSDETGDHRIRGDIHLLLVGDPGCGKSQMLRYIMSLFPNTVSTTGRGSTGVGLTAAIITDSDTGEKRVEGGAMVMGDRRIVCIDEFDKMPASDRVAIHEVLEQQTVTVAKAGIHTTLNARCTVLAAANPLYGCWSDDMDVSRQLNFERSLLSRFDLIYIVRDVTTEVEDDRIAEAILRNITQKSKPIRLSRGRGLSTGTSCVIQPTEGDMNNSIFYNVLCDGEYKNSTAEYTPTRRGIKKSKANKSIDDIFRARADMTYIDTTGEEYNILDSNFLRKYIHYCKNVYYKEMEATKGWKPFPEISEVARREIIKVYAEFREKAKQMEYKQKKLLQNVSPRTLEAIIRLSVAHAKLKLNRWVTRDNVEAVKQLLNHTIFGESINVFASVDEGSDDDFDIDIDLDDDGPDIPSGTYPATNNDEITSTFPVSPGDPTQRDGATSQKRTRKTTAPTTDITYSDGVQRENVDVSNVHHLLNCLHRLDAGDGVDVTDLYNAFRKNVEMNRTEFEQFLLSLHNSDSPTIVYSPQDFKVFSC